MTPVDGDGAEPRVAAPRMTDRRVAEPPVAEPEAVVTGRMVSLRLLRDALRRRQRVWVSLAVLGLVIGAGYHVALPVAHQATATVYLAHPAGSDQTVESKSDLALLSTPAVAQRAATRLGEPGLTPHALLGKTPGTLVSANVLTITISGSTTRQAVARVNAVTAAYLSFRNQLFRAQTAAVVAAADRQLTKLQTRVDNLTTQIDQLGPYASKAQTSTLAAERLAATTRIANLQQQVAQEQADALLVSQGSRVIDAGSPKPSSRAKVLLLDGLSGLAAGLALGLGIVVLQAILSDRLRRREDVAAVLGAPVGISTGPIGRRWFVPRGVRALATAPGPALCALVHYLDDRLAAGGPSRTELVVAVDDVRVPAAALAALAGDLSASGRRAVLVDATDRCVLGRALGTREVGSHTVVVGGAASVKLLVPPKPWAMAEDGDWEESLGDLASADAVLVLATVDPSVGAWHLRPWAAEAVVTVRAGASSAQRISAVVELLDAAGVRVSSAVLLGADAGDESVGLPQPGAAELGRRLGLVPVATAKRS